jgi:hypothetical protein
MVRLVFLFSRFQHDRLPAFSHGLIPGIRRDPGDEQGQDLLTQVCKCSGRREVSPAQEQLIHRESSGNRPAELCDQHDHDDDIEIGAHETGGSCLGEERLKPLQIIWLKV